MYMSCTTCRHLTLKLLIQGHLQNTKVPHVADFKSAYFSLIIGPRGLQYKANLKEIMGSESLMWSDLTLDPSFKVKRGYPNLKVLIIRLLLVLEACSVKST